jgi:hypothetical protein
VSGTDAVGELLNVQAAMEYAQAYAEDRSEAKAPREGHGPQDYEAKRTVSLPCDHIHVSMLMD